METFNSILDYFKESWAAFKDFLEFGIPYYFNLFLLNIVEFVKTGITEFKALIITFIEEMGINDLIQDYYGNIPANVVDTLSFIGVPEAITIILGAYVTKFVLSKIGVL